MNNPPPILTLPEPERFAAISAKPYINIHTGTSIIYRSLPKPVLLAFAPALESLMSPLSDMIFLKQDDGIPTITSEEGEMVLDWISDVVRDPKKYNEGWDETGKQKEELPKLIALHRGFVAFAMDKQDQEIREIIMTRMVNKELYATILRTLWDAEQARWEDKGMEKNVYVRLMLWNIRKYALGTFLNNSSGNERWRKKILEFVETEETGFIKEWLKEEDPELEASIKQWSNARTVQRLIDNAGKQIPKTPARPSAQPKPKQVPEHSKKSHNRAGKKSNAPRPTPEEYAEAKKKLFENINEWVQYRDSIPLRTAEMFRKKREEWEKEEESAVRMLRGEIEQNLDEEGAELEDDKDEIKWRGW